MPSTASRVIICKTHGRPVLYADPPSLSNRIAVRIPRCPSSFYRGRYGITHAPEPTKSSPIPISSNLFPTTMK